MFAGEANGALAAVTTNVPIRRYPNTPKVPFHLVPDLNPGTPEKREKIPLRTPLTFKKKRIGAIIARRNNITMTKARTLNMAPIAHSLTGVC